MTPRQKLDALLALLAPDIRDAFVASISNVVDNVIVEQIVQAIEARDFERVFVLLGFSPGAMRPLIASVERGFEQSAEALIATFPKKLNTPMGKMSFFFDVRNPQAEKWLREKSSSLITRIESETRNNVRNTVEAGFRDGRNPRSVALDIVGRVDPTSGKRTGGIVGLTEPQENWVRSARIKLLTLDEGYFDMSLRDKRFDSVVRRAIDSRKALPIDTVDKLITRYKANALRLRGEAIGRTEAMQSMAAADYEATRQVVASGGVRASAIKRVWDDVGDRRTRHSHRMMNGQTVGFDEPFTTPDGHLLMYPGDTSLDAPGKEVILCRCRVRTVVDWFDGVT